MQPSRIHIPNPTIAVAVVALLVALGGTSYAAFSLPRNSVGTKQLKKGAVTLAKISGGTRTALTSQTGPKGDAGPPGPAYAPGPLSFTNASLGTNWTVDTNFGTSRPGFARDAFGTVHLRGSVDGQHGGIAIDPAFILPVGFRPAAAVFNFAYEQCGATQGTAEVFITAAGAVNIDSTSSACDAFVSLDGISFQGA